jgi:hypothetical protein
MSGNPTTENNPPRKLRESALSRDSNSGVTDAEETQPTNIRRTKKILISSRMVLTQDTALLWNKSLLWFSWPTWTRELAKLT